jgi:hypothetical protein|tara:strand:+ start:510 stop:1412 length:903 start_codon:yes stop_codon:yes gene_type:complete
MANNVAVADNSLLTTYDEYKKLSNDDRLSMTGQGGKVGNMLPKLKINYASEIEADGKDISIPKGQWTITFRDADDKPVSVFGEKVTVRAFFRGYRYSVWDTDNEKLILLSSIFKNWNESVIDNMGNEHTAGKYKKAMIRDFPEYETSTTQLKCQQIIYGRATFENAVDMHKKPVEVVDLPMTWVAKGSGFMPVSDAIKVLTDRKVLMEEYPFTITTHKLKKGAVTYWEPVLEEGPPVDFTEDDFLLAKRFQQTIVTDNNEVLAAFQKRLESDKSDTSADGIIDGSDLSSDFTDELPLNMQ